MPPTARAVPTLVDSGALTDALTGDGSGGRPARWPIEGVGLLARMNGGLHPGGRSQPGGREVEVKYCGECGHRLEQRVPDGDNRERNCCPSCSHIAYDNPRLIVGCVVEHEGKLLLCRRAIEPRRGYWTCPGGFLELDEGVVEGARRETWEEACARVEIDGLHSHFDVPHIGQSYVYFRARLVGEEFGAGEESLETALFDVADIPWDEIAFPVLRYALQFWVEDRELRERRVHLGIVEWKAGAPKYDIAGYRMRDHLAETVVSGS